MCQLLGVSTSEPVNLSFSWKRFAKRGSAELGNPDGWGVAYIEDNDALILREPSPAANSPLVHFLGEQGPACHTVISHVRRATRGSNKLCNTQPFRRTLGGRVHVFAHNGHIVDVDYPFESGWLTPVGDTDSERIFSLLLQRLEPLWKTTQVPSIDERTLILREFAEEMRVKGAANFLYSDGITLFAHAHRKTLPGHEISTDPGLYVLQCEHEHVVKNEPLCEGLLDAECYGKHVLIATVPLDQQNWRPMYAGELLRIEKGQVV